MGGWVGGWGAGVSECFYYESKFFFFGVGQGEGGRLE